MMDKKTLKDHLEMHQDFPATKAEMMKTCEEMSDVSKEEKEWFEKTLEDKTYTSANDVYMALGM